MKPAKKKNANRPSKKTHSAPVVVRETTRLIAQPRTVLHREPVTLARALGERVVAEPVSETEVIRSVGKRRTLKRR